MQENGRYERERERKKERGRDFNSYHERETERTSIRSTKTATLRSSLNYSDILFQATRPFYDPHRIGWHATSITSFFRFFHRRVKTTPWSIIEMMLPRMMRSCVKWCAANNGGETALLMPLNLFDDCSCRNPFFSLFFFLFQFIERLSRNAFSIGFAATCRFIWHGDYTCLFKAILVVDSSIAALKCGLKWLSWNLWRDA